MNTQRYCPTCAFRNERPALGATATEPAEEGAYKCDVTGELVEEHDVTPDFHCSLWADEIIVDGDRIIIDPPSSPAIMALWVTWLRNEIREHQNDLQFGHELMRRPDPISQQEGASLVALSVKRLQEHRRQLENALAP